MNQTTLLLLITACHHRRRLQWLAFLLTRFCADSETICWLVAYMHKRGNHSAAVDFARYDHGGNSVEYLVRRFVTGGNIKALNRVVKLRKTKTLTEDELDFAVGGIAFGPDVDEQGEMTNLLAEIAPPMYVKKGLPPGFSESVRKMLASNPKLTTL